ncbi:MAG: TonB family protein [Burkholderiales bacterium]|nr:TonB family protein [Burkholderiales bacterium]
MSEQDPGAPAHKALRACAVALAMHAIAATGAYAQAPSATASDGAPSEAARRAAASPYRFILQHSAAPARRPAAEPPPRREKAPEAPVQATAARTAPEPAPAPLPVAVPAAAQPAPVAAPRPEPVQMATRNAKPPEPPPRREVIPVRIDEPRLPPALLRERPNGVVKVQFEIHPDGSTGAVKVLASNNSVLNRPTVNAVSAWKFQPVDEILTVETEIAYKYD